MGILKQFKNNASNLSRGGSTPDKRGGALSTSKLHDAYSINNDPNIADKPIPSQLDLDGATPAKYQDTQFEDAN